MKKWIKSIFVKAKELLLSDVTAKEGKHSSVAISRNLTQFTFLLDNDLANEFILAAREMKIQEPDLMVILIKLIKIIRENGLYGMPSVSGSQLGFTEKGKTFTNINIDCPAAEKKIIVQEITNKKLTN